MRDYLDDFLTSGEGDNLKTPIPGKYQKAQKSPVGFENTQRGQGSKGSKATFDTFDTSPPGEYSKIQPPSGDDRELPAHIRDGLRRERIPATADEYGPRLTMKMSGGLYVAVANYRRERYLAGEPKPLDREPGTFMSLSPDAEELTNERWIEF